MARIVLSHGSSGPQERSHVEQVGTLVLCAWSLVEVMVATGGAAAPGAT